MTHVLERSHNRERDLWSPKMLTYDICVGVYFFHKKEFEFLKFSAVYGKGEMAP